MTSLSYLVGQHEYILIIKAVSDKIFDVIFTTYHDKPLKSSSTMLQEITVSRNWAMRSFFHFFSKKDSTGVYTEQTLDEVL